MSAKKTDLSTFLRLELASPPRAGNGVHRWLFLMGRKLHHQCTEGQIFVLLKAAVAGCGREVPDREIWDAILNSREYAWRPGGRGFGRSRVACPWPPVDPVARQRAIDHSAVRSIMELNNESPVSVDQQPCTEDVIDALMPDNPLICVGRDKNVFWTQARETFRGTLAKMPLIVPSPMSALRGRVKSNGRWSAHTLDNTGERQYLITEFDSGDSDEQAALIWHLACNAPLVMVVDSAGKSLHAWWECAGQCEHSLKHFMNYAVSLGADKATWTRSQFVRMPGGLRDEIRPQRIHYFDPDAGKEGA